MDAWTSDWDCALERTRGGAPALRLGLRRVRGLSRRGADRLISARTAGPWRSVTDLARRAALDRGDLKALAGADALVGLAGNRHLAAWQVAGIQPDLPLAPAREGPGPLPLLAPPGEGEAIAADYASLGLTLRRHPLALLRGQLTRRRLLSAAEVGTAPPGGLISAAGLVVNRQRPGSAHNVTFVTLEDETGYVNLVVWQALAERRRKVLLGARLLGVTGKVQRESGVTHLIARRLVDYSALLNGLVTRSRDFR